MEGGKKALDLGRRGEVTRKRQKKILTVCERVWASVPKNQKTGGIVTIRLIACNSSRPFFGKGQTPREGKENKKKICLRNKGGQRKS